MIEITSVLETKVVTLNPRTMGKWTLRLAFMFGLGLGIGVSSITLWATKARVTEAERNAMGIMYLQQEAQKLVREAAGCLR